MKSEKSMKSGSEKSMKSEKSEKSDKGCGPMVMCPAQLGPLDDRVYVLTTPRITFGLPDYSETNCALDYTIIVSRTTDGMTYTDFPPMVFDPITNTFVVYWADNLTYTSETEAGTDYIVNVVGANGIDIVLEAAFILTLKNPCFGIEYL